MSSLLKWLQEFAGWLLDTLLWLPLKVWELLTDALAAVLEAIPVPEWLDEVDLWGAVPDSVAFFLAAFEIPSGIAIVLGAYGIRFMIRRLPFVG